MVAGVSCALLLAFLLFNLGGFAMKRPILLLTLGAALALGGCSTNGLIPLTQHLNERGCWTKGNAAATAGLTGTQIGGSLEWDCGKKAAERE